MAWYHRLRNTMRSERLSGELNRELEFHLAERVDELVASGMTEEEATREARLAEERESWERLTEGVGRVLRYA